MDVGRTPAPGFDLEDVSLIYEPCAARDREGRNMGQVEAKAKNDIYTYISRPLTDEVSVCANLRLNACFNTTFYDDEYAMR